MTSLREPDTSETIKESPTMYHYTVSGMDNIYLKDVTADGPDGFTVCIPSIDDLHDRLCRYLALVKRPLRGLEIMFLRTEMGLTLEDLESSLNIEAGTIEESRTFRLQSGPADRLLRLLALNACGDDPVDARTFGSLMDDIDPEGAVEEVVLKHNSVGQWVVTEPRP